MAQQLRQALVEQERIRHLLQARLLETQRSFTRQLEEKLRAQQSSLESRLVESEAIQIRLTREGEKFSERYSRFLGELEQALIQGGVPHEAIESTGERRTLEIQKSLLEVIRRLELAEAAKDKLAHELQGVYRSLSWRLTAPLRSIKSWVTLKS